MQIKQSGLMILAAIGLMGLISCGSQRDTASDKASADSEAATKQEIDRTRNEYIAAWKAADATRIVEQYAEEALVLYPNRPAIVGKSAIHDYFTNFFAEFDQNDFALSSDEIIVTGDWAFDRGTYIWKGTPRAGGSAIEDNGKYLVVLQKQADGRWRVARDMDNSDRPALQLERGAN